MFPDFDDNIRKGFRTETEMFFGYILRDDRSALELLSADYTFVDERLARHYGIKGVYGPQFRRVKLTDPNRRGLLGQGSILSMTSVATRTSPVYRGKYVLSTFLNTPPPPAAAECPFARRKQQGLEGSQDSARAAGIASQEPALRGLPSRDRSAGVCARELRFGGVWRDKGADGAPLDVAGTLADGTKVNGPVALREAILSRPDAFVTVVTEKMLTYALGRGLEPGDMPVVRRIVKKAAQNDYRLSSVIMGIVESAPFQMRTKLEPAGNGRGTPADAVKLARSNNCTIKEGAAMIITKKHLSRRTFVRGALGATVALPFLDAMIPALSAAPKSPFRFGAVYFPCGVFPTTWHPDAEGSDFVFKPVMQPLEPFRNQLVTVSKMKAPWG